MMQKLALVLCVAVLVCGCSRSTVSAPDSEEHGKYVTITEANFKAEVLDSAQPVMIDFWAPWCGPCRAMGPIVNDLAGAYEGRAKVGKLNVDDNQAITREYGINGIPALLFFKDGKMVEKVVGIQPRAELEAKLKALLN